MTAKSVDFLIIGAQKSGTTSLYKYLSAHSQIYMPTVKEVRFFTTKEKYARGLDWYLVEYFGKASASQRTGEASPQYMFYTYVPSRIHSMLPDTKLVAMLRNPIERAYSHFRTVTRHGFERRPFDVCVANLLTRGGVSDEEVDEKRDYVMFGEYGRILENYLRWFPRERIKTLFLEEMSRRPEDAVRDVFRFLDVSDEVPKELSYGKYNRGGEIRFPWLAQCTDWGSRQEWLKRSLKRVLLREDLNSIRQWIDKVVNLRPVAGPGPSKRTREVLRKHYSGDVELLEEIHGRKVPWDEFS